MSWPPGTTGSGPAPARIAGLSVLISVIAGGGGPVVTCVFTSAEVLFNSLPSTIPLSGSTTAVLVIVPVARGDVALMVMVAFDPWFTAPPVHVTVWPATPQTKRLVPVAPMAVRPAGTVSTTLMSVAGAVPMLLTVSVYVIGDEVG